MRTAMGARAIKPLATTRTASPGRKPNSASRRPNSTGVAASDAAMDTTRAGMPILNSVRRMGADSGFVNINAILYENRSHYYYGGWASAEKPRRGGHLAFFGV